MGERVRAFVPSTVSSSELGKIRSTPGGTNIGRQINSIEGIILEGPVFGGVDHWGFAWWRVDFDSGPDGWVAGVHNTGNSSLAGLRLLDGSLLIYPSGAGTAHCPNGIIPLDGSLGDSLGNFGRRGEELAYKEIKCYSVQVTQQKDFLVIGTESELAVGLRVIGEIKADLTAPAPQDIKIDGSLTNTGGFGNFAGGEGIVRSAGGGKVPAGEYILRIERKPTQTWIENQCARGVPSGTPLEFFCKEKQKFTVYWRQENRIDVANYTCPAGYEEFVWWGAGRPPCGSTQGNCLWYGKGRGVNNQGGIDLPFGQTRKYCAINRTPTNGANFYTAAYNNSECNAILFRVTPPRGSGIAGFTDIYSQPQANLFSFDRNLSLGAWLVELSASNDTRVADPSCVGTYAAITNF